MPLSLGVAIVSYRSRGQLPSCFAALAAATAGAPVAIVVVDNASDDGTPDWVAREHPDVRLIRNPENRGFAAAVNQACRGLETELVLLLNPDARPEPDCVARLARAFEDDAALGVASPQLVSRDGRLQRSTWPAPGWLGAMRDECLSGACLVLRRACFDVLGGFDESFFLYHEDFDLCVRARAAGWRVRLVPEARAVHDVGGSAFQDRASFWARYHASRIRFLRKHHPGASGRVLAACYRAAIGLRALANRVGGALAARRDLEERARWHADALRAIKRAKV